MADATNKDTRASLEAHGLLLQVRAAPDDETALRHIEDAYRIVTDRLRTRRDELLAANNAEVERRRAAETKVRDLRGLLDSIATDLEGARRAGGPDPTDLHDLDDAICRAVNRILAATDPDFRGVEP